MKFEYTRPEIEITLFSTESIMDSATDSGDSSKITIEVDETNTPGTISADTWNL